MNFPTALSIAGSDCIGGAGIQADLKTFSANHVYGMSVITSVVAENTFEVISTNNLQPNAMKDQMDAVFNDIVPDAIKIGMIPNEGILSEVISGLKNYYGHVVLDPVMLAKNGASLTNISVLRPMIDNLFPICSLVTPNIPEAEAMAGEKIKSLEDMQDCCKKIYNLNCNSVLLKGGHLGTNECVDIFYDGKTFEYFIADRIDTRNTHGTGCTYSSAIAANLARKLSMIDSIKAAKKYVTNAIMYNPGIGKGHGPINHFFSTNTENN